MRPDPSIEEVVAPAGESDRGLSIHPNLLNEVHHEHGFHDVCTVFEKVS